MKTQRSNNFTSTRASPAVLLLLSTLISHLSTSAHAQGGSLTPPPGAPGPVMKSLAQIEPRTDLANVAGDANYHHIITAPGSYYLSGNVDVTKSNGIYVDASNVTLDLNGFSVRRTAGSGGGGIFVNGSQTHLAIRNGTVSGFNSGIAAVTATGASLTDITISSCSYRCVLAGQGSRLKNIRAVANFPSSLDFYAFVIWTDSVLVDCIASGNSHSGSATSCGFYLYDRCKVTRCTASGNTAASGALFGFQALNGCTFTDCTASGNESMSASCTGIEAGSNCTLTGCVADSNTSGTSICHGIKLLDAGTVIHCSARSNTGVNAGDTSLSGVGISGQSQCAITDCSVVANKGDGIRLTSKGLVRGCLAEGNGAGTTGAGIHTTQINNQIDGNKLTGNTTGLRADTTGSLILRNTATANTTHFILATGNHVGVIVATPASSAISGSTGGAGMGTTDPWANLAY
ncbi:MAG: hypothetical protein K1X78_10830 [Verrucomicrobiaceae bacterium]|nr:hypothetical protein [Verrucomicrobiaceae bacterium]